MNRNTLEAMYDFTGRTAAITGGAGILGREIGLALAGLGAAVVVMDKEKARADAVVAEIESEGGQGLSVHTDVLDPDSLNGAAKQVASAFERIDFLVNAAGGNDPGATTGPDLSFFDLPGDAFRFVFDLNLLGTILPCQVFGKRMADQGEGIILNISSMNAFRPLTRIPAYSAAKAGISNFTQWLAVHMAQEYSTKFRVNAVAPGFFLTNQNRFLLKDRETGDVTPRGRKILDHTPMARFGDPKDLLGTVAWLLSPASAFVTGTVVPVDGGFSAYSGV
jgi:NAD(P)-dependent dehydrogenase (short-subunit alcohol dehydrogenase family)